MRPHIQTMWCWWIDATANANAQVLGSDGIHPSMDSNIYAKAVKQAIEQWIASGR